MNDWEHQNREYEECSRCREAKNQLQTAVNQQKQTLTQIASEQQRDVQLQRDLASARQTLTEKQAERPALDTELARMDGIWTPMKEMCYSTYDEYKVQLDAWMIVDVPTFYDKSCEKACLETSLVDAGCGVMEGAFQGDIYKVGHSEMNPGLRTVCSPPFASFIRSPVKYGAKPETETELCDRLYGNAGQRPRQSSYISLKTVMYKRERLFRRWRTRFFVLEEGSNVRSALIRYWDKHPSLANATEANTVKSIIVWDATSVKAEPGSLYGWRDGSECLKLSHFYRDFRLCVKPDVPENGNETAAAIRDQWVQRIQANIRFASRATR